MIFCYIFVIFDILEIIAIFFNPINKICLLSHFPPYFVFFTFIILCWTLRSYRCSDNLFIEFRTQYL